MGDHEAPFADRRIMTSEPPVPVGTGAFRIKGAGFLGHMAWVDAHYPGGRPAFLAALTPAMRSYFETVFLALSWYDLLALAAAGHVCAKAVGMPYRDFIVMRSRHQAEIDLGGMYRVLLRIASPRMAAPRIPKVMSQYLDFGDVKIRDESDKHLGFDVTGVPIILADWLLGVYEGFADVVLTTTGAKKPTLVADVVRQGSAHGFALATLKAELRWG